MCFKIWWCGNVIGNDNIKFINMKLNKKWFGFSIGLFGGVWGNLLSKLIYVDMNIIGLKKILNIVFLIWCFM